MDDKIKIIFLEDNEADRELILIELIKAGFSFESKYAETRVQYIRALVEFKPDIILSDYSLPSFDGMEALRIMQEKGLKIPFIFVTGTLGEDLAVETVKQGATDYVLKQNLSRLPLSIKRALSEAEDRKKLEAAEQALRESENMLSEAEKVAGIGSWSVDINAASLKCSIEMLHLFGIDPRKFNGSLEMVFGNIDPEDLPGVEAAYNSLLTGEVLKTHEYHILISGGGKRPVYSKAMMERDENGKPAKLIGYVQDITERKKADLEIGRLNRVYALISQINQMVVKTREQNTLFSQACLIAIEYGKFRMAWIGLIDEKERIVRPIAWDGVEEGYLTTIKKIAIDDVPESRGPTGTAIRTGKVCFCNDIANDPIMANWRDKALKRGYRSSISLPIITKGKAIGAFNIYASEPYFFNEAEIRLLEEVTGNIAYVLEIIELEHGRNKAEDELHKYHEHLEDLVKERTIELEKINARLESEIKDRTRMEEELARGRNMLRTLIDSLPDEIYAKDNESRFTMANSHVLRSFGRKNFDEIIGKTDFNLLPKEEAMKAYAKEHTVLQYGGQVVNYEERVADNNGRQRWYSITKVPMRDSEGRIIGLVGINRDITDFKEVEENLHAAKEAAENANRAKSTFLSSMSHEIRTPLNAVLGFSELMLHDDNLTPQQIEHLATINRSGEHLLSLINDILEISKIEAGRISFNLSTFDLHALLQEMEAMFKIKAEAKKLNLLVECSYDVPRLIATDEKKLRQILINIIGNAVKFTQKGGITVKARTDMNANSKMRLAVEVEDTGPGIAQKEIGNLFQMFGQTEIGIKEEGTGLGLAISQQYAKIMGGNISVKSEAGKGACFTIMINIEKSGVQLKKEDYRKGYVKGVKNGKESYRVLIADDRTDNRKLLRRLLTSVGFKVDEAKDGMEAIKKFKTSLPDLILMDMQMPVMNGYEAINSIKAMCEKRIPIIAVTASAFYEDKQKAIGAGADAYIRKPFKEHELLECIESCMGIQFVYENDINNTHQNLI